MELARLGDHHGARGRRRGGICGMSRSNTAVLIQVPPVAADCAVDPTSPASRLSGFCRVFIMLVRGGYSSYEGDAPGGRSPHKHNKVLVFYCDGVLQYTAWLGRRFRPQLSQ